MATPTIPLTKCTKLYELYAVFAAFAHISKRVNYTITLDSSKLPVNTDIPIPIDTGGLSSNSNITPIYVYWNTTDEGIKTDIANSIKAEADKYKNLGDRGVEEREVIKEVIENVGNEALNDLINQINKGTKQGETVETVNIKFTETDTDSDTDNAPNFTTEENDNDSDQEQVNTDTDNDTKQPPEIE